MPELSFHRDAVSFVLLLIIFAALIAALLAHLNPII